MNRRPGIWASAVALAAMTGMSIWAAPRLGERVPIHWNLSGEADGYGGRVQGLVALPLLTLGISLMLAFLPRIEPRRAHLEQSGRAYQAVWIAVLVVLAGVHATALLVGAGYAVPVGTVVPGLVAVLLLVMGNYFGKVRSNFFFGIRTPWTLASERSWDRTHRLAGRLFSGAGGLALLSLPFGPRATAAVLFAGLLVAVAVPAAYSYVVWRDDLSRAH